jgi:predicted PurR-regulated permease PerM
MSALAEILPSRFPKRSLPTVVSLAVLIGLLYVGKLFFVTLLSALVISFILEPVVEMFTRLRLPRGPASFFACALAIGALYFLTLGAYLQVVVLVEDLPTYALRLSEMGNAAMARVENVEQKINEVLPKRMQERTAISEPPAPAPVKGRTPRRRAEPEPPKPPPVQEVRIQQEQPSLYEWAYNYLSGLWEVLVAISFVPFLVYFMLSWRDHIQRSFLQLFEGEGRSEVGRSLKVIAEVSRAYIAGNFVLGILLSVVTTILFLFLRLPYAFLVGPISGFLSLLPYIGLPLAIIPPVFAALPVYTRLPQYLILATAIAFLHLLALNLLYPKVVGARVHLNPLSVTVALMFWGLLWGGAGLALAIPITAGLKAVCDNVSGLEVYGTLLGD